MPLGLVLLGGSLCHPPPPPVDVVPVEEPQPPAVDPVAADDSRWIEVGSRRIDDEEYAELLQLRADLEHVTEETALAALSDRLTRQLVDELRFVAECERLGIALTRADDMEEHARERSESFEARLARMGYTLASWRREVSAHECFGELWYEHQLLEAPTDDEVRGFYAAHRDRYTSRSPWVSYATITFAYAPTGSTGNPICDAFLGHLRRCASGASPEAKSLFESKHRSELYAWRHPPEDESLDARCLYAFGYRYLDECDLPLPKGPFRRERAPSHDLRELERRATAVRTQIGSAPIEQAAKLLSGPGEYRDDFGLRPADDVDSLVAPHLATLQPGEVSKPVLVDSAWMLLSVVAREPAGSIAVEKIWAQVEEDTSEHRIYEAWNGMWNDLASRHPVRVAPGLSYDGKLSKSFWRHRPGDRGAE